MTMLICLLFPLAAEAQLRFINHWGYLQDYQCHQVPTTDPISKFDSLDRLLDSYKSLMCQVSSIPELVFFHQAVRFPE